MTPAEEETQRAANGAALEGFMQRLAEAVPAKPDDADDKADPADSDDADDDPNHPFSEEDAEKMLAESDKLTDRVMARMEREGETADFEQILEEEMERARKERGEPDPTPEQLAERDRRIEELNAAAEEALKEEETEQWKDGAAGSTREKHPLAERAYEFGFRVRQEVAAHNWIPKNAQQEHPVEELTNSLARAAAKLAGALNSRQDWPPPLILCGTTIVLLKRAAGFLDDAKLAAESCGEESLVDPEWLAGVVREMDAIAAEAAALIAELRARLKEGIE